ncbi:hypothetical protein LMTR3_09500 [Bradyrhizobium sp. LMTR 3]|nr:hypothetical protein LMTR3_09500 [Bradyrhizobium sp. LMTR 3]
MDGSLGPCAGRRFDKDQRNPAQLARHALLLHRKSDPAVVDQVFQPVQHDSTCEETAANRGSTAANYRF